MKAPGCDPQPIAHWRRSRGSRPGSESVPKSNPDQTTAEAYQPNERDSEGQFHRKRLRCHALAHTPACGRSRECALFHPSISPPVHLSITLSLSLSLLLYLTVCLSVCLSVCVSICLSLCLSLHLPIFLSICLSISVLVQLSKSLSIYLCVQSFHLLQGVPKS